MTEEGYSYRNLILWQKAQNLTLAIVKIAARLPKDEVARVLARQIVRSASSIAANVAEGHGRYTLAAHRNHLSIAKGSACETDSWLDLLHRAGYIDDDRETSLHASCEEIVRMLTAKIKEFERREQAGTKRIHDESAPYEVSPTAPEDFEP